MTREDKELLIKDLCARLPYGVKFKSDSIRDKSLIYDTLEGIDNDLVNPINEFAYDIEDIKPYLFPMSSMTEEQKKEYFDICWNDWIDNKAKDIEETEVLSKGVDWLNAHHFDYHGLIGKGLAIDATNLNIY